MECLVFSGNLQGLARGRVLMYQYAVYLWLSRCCGSEITVYLDEGPIGVLRLLLHTYGPLGMTFSNPLRGAMFGSSYDASNSHILIGGR